MSDVSFIQTVSHVDDHLPPVIRRLTSQLTHDQPMQRVHAALLFLPHCYAAAALTAAVTPRHTQSPPQTLACVQPPEPPLHFRHIDIAPYTSARD